MMPFPSWQVLRRWPISFLRLRLDTADDRNAWYLSAEVFWAAILGSVASFNAAYALRLGAENSHIGLLSSIPALLAAVVSIPAGHFLERRTRRKGWVLGSLMMHRMGYALVALVPFVPAHWFNRGALLVLLLVVMGPPAHFFGVGFNAMLADVVPERRRAAVFATRNIISVATSSVGLLLIGQLLNRVVFPVNYQIAYALGFAASVVSLAFLYKLRVPDSHVRVEERQVRQSLRQRMRSLRELGAAYPGFVRFVTSTLLYNLGAWAAGPLYTLFYVRQLGASDAWLGSLGAVSNVSSVVGYAAWRRVIERWGDSRTLKRIAPGAALFPILVGTLRALTPILVVAGLDGLIVTGVNLSHFNLYLKACPSDRRPMFMGLYSTIMNVAAFVAPLIGVVAAERFGLAPTIIACGVCRALGGLAFRVWPVSAAMEAD